MSESDARAWGRKQAARSPAWSEEKWRRIAQIIGVTWVQVADAAEPTARGPDMGRGSPEGGSVATGEFREEPVGVPEVDLSLKRDGLFVGEGAPSVGA